MNLHENKKLFTDAVLAAAEQLDIKAVYIEKDYWITRSLKLMAQDSNAERAIFKGGTSLSKAYKIGNRFSEDIDVAISDANSLSGNQLKMLIKRIAKEMTVGLDEFVVQGVTSKGSRYYKAMYAYPNILGKAIKEIVNVGQLLVEINSFANPYPYEQKVIECFISDFFRQTGNDNLIEEYDMRPFSMNVLDKRQTFTEKLVSLIRFSLSDNICMTWQQKYAISTTCIIFCRIKIVLYICILNNFAKTLRICYSMIRKHSTNRKDGRRSI